MIWLGIAAKWVVKTWTGRVVAGVVVGWVALLINNAWQRSIGANQVVTSSVKQAKKANDTNAAIREKVKVPGAPERVLRDFCRDCD